MRSFSVCLNHLNKKDLLPNMHVSHLNTCPSMFMKRDREVRNFVQELLITPSSSILNMWESNEVPLTRYVTSFWLSVCCTWERERDWFCSWMKLQLQVHVIVSTVLLVSKSWLHKLANLHYIPKPEKVSFVNDLASLCRWPCRKRLPVEYSSDDPDALDHFSQNPTYKVLPVVKLALFSLTTLDFWAQSS